MPKPDRSNVKAVRVSLILDIVVPEGMEERGEDEIFAMLREADDGELRGSIEYSDDDAMHIMDYIWEDWEARQEGADDEQQSLILRLSLDELLGVGIERLNDLTVERAGCMVEGIAYEVMGSVDGGDILIRAIFTQVREEGEA